MQRGLKADLCFLDGHHGLFQAHGRVLELHFTLQVAGMVLRGAHGLQGTLERMGKTPVELLRRGGRCCNAAWQVGAGDRKG
ncbi:hypothetical protein D3C79_954770 [compost metagenome]